jgi:hypothetical protein
METITVKLKESQARLVQQGTAWFEKTTKAGTTFAGKTRTAGTTFLDQTRKAGTQFVSQSRTATESLAAGVRTEASLWADVVGVSRFEAEIPRLPKTDDVVSAERTLERRILGALQSALDELHGRVKARLTWLEQQGLQLPAETETTNGASASKTNGAKSNGAKADGAGASKTNGTKAADPVAPITGYDELSAKDVVARLERVTGEKAEAILAYENATKKRQTVIRAAEARLAE